MPLAPQAEISKKSKLMMGVVVFFTYVMGIAGFGLLMTTHGYGVEVTKELHELKMVLSGPLTGAIGGLLAVLYIFDISVRQYSRLHQQKKIHFAKASAGLLECHRVCVVQYWKASAARAICLSVVGLLVLVYLMLQVCPIVCRQSPTPIESPAKLIML